MAPLAATTSKYLAQWRDGLERGLGYDAWGQVLEACKEYTRVAQAIRDCLATTEEPNFTDQQARFLVRVAGVCQLRTKAVQDLTGDETTVSFKDVKSLTPAIAVFEDHIPPFPVENIDSFRHLVDLSYTPPQQAAPEAGTPGKGGAKPAQRQQQQQQPLYMGDSDEEDEGEKDTKRAGTLLRRTVFPGKTNIMIRIVKIELKDPGSYIEPFFTVSVKDSQGKDIASSQDTPPTNKRDQFIHFNQDVDIPIALEDLPKDSAIFLEFKHFKPRKNKISTKCYSFMEFDEIKNSTFPLEIYAKPTDFRRKKLHLLTEKPHYVYVSVALTEN